VTTRRSQAESPTPGTRVRACWTIRRPERSLGSHPAARDLGDGPRKVWADIAESYFDALLRPPQRLIRLTGCPTCYRDADPAECPERALGDHRCIPRPLAHPGAPRSSECSSLLANVQDDAGHGLYLLRAAETLGFIPATNPVDPAAHRRRSTRHLQSTRHPGPVPTSAPIGWLWTAPRIVNPGNPSVPLLVRSVGLVRYRICKEGVLHQLQGYRSCTRSPMAPT